MDLSILDGPLEVLENPGLETTDERLDDIATLAQDGNYAAAAEAAQAILEERIYDVRMLGFFFYGSFLEQGVAALQPVMETLLEVLRDNWQAFGPLTRKEKQAQTSLRWFINQLLGKLQHEESTRSEQYEAWTVSVTTEAVQETMATIEEVRGELAEALQDAAEPLMDGLGKLVQWLGAFQQFLRPPESEPEEEEEEEAAAPEEEAPPAPSTDQPQATAEGSYHLQMLIRKMDAFSRLIEAQKYMHAALVADDVSEIIDSFDPRIFFPKLFSNFMLLLAQNIEEITAFEENKESPEWQVFKEYYKVDLDGFVDL